MEINGKLTKQITETKYLNVENTERYRPIMRIFFEHYEKLDYWLYKEDVYNELKNQDGFVSYTIEMCEQDLNQLVSWQSLSYFQDTDNVSTVDEFKNRRYRYQMTEYAREIERFVMRLETLQVKQSSLEPKLFEKIRNLINKLITATDIKIIHECFEELNYNFTTLNENYKDFLKMFHEAKAEDMMKTENFIIYKDKVITYLRDFISGFQTNSLKIVDILDKLPQDFEDTLLNALDEYQKSIPILESNFDYDYLKELNRGKWRSIKGWFKNDSGISESKRLKNAINDIINKIMKNVSAIIEMQASGVNRKEEYIHILKMFCNTNTLEDAKDIGVVAFGIPKVEHFSKIEKVTEMLDIDSLDIDPLYIELKSHSRKVKEATTKRAIVDKTLAKKEQLEAITAIRNREKAILDNHINAGEIDIKMLNKVSSFERRFILSLISSGLYKDDFVSNGNYGIKYKVIKNSNEYIDLISDDGVLRMPDLKIVFGGRNE